MAEKATAHITITNRFVSGAQNDKMTLSASGLPTNTGFDLFLVQNSPLDSGTFSAYVDGMKIGTQNGAIPNLMRQRIGFQRYAGGTAGEMWIDDVAIGPNRIGCM